MSAVRCPLCRNGYQVRQVPGRKETFGGLEMIRYLGAGAYLGRCPLCGMDCQGRIKDGTITFVCVFCANRTGSEMSHVFRLPAEGIEDSERQMELFPCG